MRFYEDTNQGESGQSHQGASTYINSMYVRAELKYECVCLKTGE